MNKSLRNNNGFTLVELLFALVLLGLITGVIYSLIQFSNRSFTVNSNQYDVQSEVRLAVDAVTRAVRYATTLELVDAEEICSLESYEKGISYIYIDEGNLCHIIYDKEQDKHRKVTYKGHLISDSDVFSKAESCRLLVKITSQSQAQSHKGETEITLLNIKANGGGISGTSGSGLKYCGCLSP